MQSMRHGVPLPSERCVALLTLLCIGGITSVFKDRSRFFFIVFRIGNSASQSPKSCTRKSEEATRQQGGIFFRENSSNGGKAIRTFWRNTKFGKITCQGQNSATVSLCCGVSYRGYRKVNMALPIRHSFAYNWSDHISNDYHISRLDPLLHRHQCINPAIHVGCPPLHPAESSPDGRSDRSAGTP